VESEKSEERQVGRGMGADTIVMESGMVAPYSSRMLCFDAFSWFVIFGTV